MRVLKVVQSNDKYSSLRVTIPVDIARKMGIKKGDVLLWEIKENKIQVKKEVHDDKKVVLRNEGKP